MDAMLQAGALGGATGLRHGSGPGTHRGARPHGGGEPTKVSAHAKERQKNEMGTLGSGNHYLEVQHVTAVHDARHRQDYGLAAGDVVITIHCGSRGLGHQIGTDYLKEMVMAAPPASACRTGNWPARR